MLEIENVKGGVRTVERERILITGVAGFIGFHLARRLVAEEKEIIGVDNLNHYYDVRLKQERIKQLIPYSNFKFKKIDIKDKEAIEGLFKEYHFDKVIHLAAQAGVRYSIKNPYAYVDSNLIGFMNIIEACRNYPVSHLLYASSSSVYGGNTQIPYSTNQAVDHPLSLYAATKKSNELIAHAYSHLYSIPITGLRFFTVYGPWGRPDMAYFSFTKDILAGKTIKVFNYGKMERDFTYIDDVVEAVERLLPMPPERNPKWSDVDGNLSESFAPYKIYNIGNSNPTSLKKFISILEEKLEKRAQKEYLPIQPGDVLTTYADTSDLESKIHFIPHINIEVGLGNFVDWYKDFYKNA